MPNKVLFVLKHREVPDPNAAYGMTFSSGLLNSATFMHDMLVANKVDSKLVEVADNTFIDKEVALYQPTHVIIEALWVVPEKFDELQKLHPNVTWVIRCHSEIPFLAGEGIAMDWICRYLNTPNLVIAGNSERAVADIKTVVRAAKPAWSEHTVESRVVALPNYYPYDQKLAFTKKASSDTLDVACFGAIRPFKNQLLQAIAAIQFANTQGKTLRFHINGGRSEGGDNNLKNIRSLFQYASNHQLVEHAWVTHDDFLNVLGAMDIGMQVSYSETFSIVAADMVTAGLPVVVSPEIFWTSTMCQADPNNADDMAKKLDTATSWRTSTAVKALNRRGLRNHCESAKQLWLDYFVG